MSVAPIGYKVVVGYLTAKHKPTGENHKLMVVAGDCPNSYKCIHGGTVGELHVNTETTINSLWDKSWKSPAPSLHVSSLHTDLNISSDSETKKLANEEWSNVGRDMLRLAVEKSLLLDKHGYVVLEASKEGINKHPATFYRRFGFRTSYPINQINEETQRAELNPRNALLDQKMDECLRQKTSLTGEGDIPMAIKEGLGLEAMRIRKNGGSIDKILDSAPPGTKANVMTLIRIRRQTF